MVVGFCRLVRPALVAALLMLIGCGADHPPEGIISASEIQPFPWRAKLNNIQPGFHIDPHDTWSVDFDLEVDFGRYRERYGRFTQLITAIYAERRYDAEGNYRSGIASLAVSNNFSTTGLPIERFEGWVRLRLLHGKDGSPFEAVQTFPLAAGKLKGTKRFSGNLRVVFPRDFPPGRYEPRFLVFVRVEGVANPVELRVFGRDWNEEMSDILPLVAVGSIAVPRLPWTILSQVRHMGRSGALPEEDKGKVALIGRSGFPTALIIPPGRREITPAFPTIFPRSAIAALDGGREVIPTDMPHYFDFDRGEVSCRVSGPGGRFDLGTKTMIGADSRGALLAGGGFQIDMTQTGEYEIVLKGHLFDIFGTRFDGGGSYRVTSALPLTFSTSVKPGTNFLVGDSYPAKVNVNPPFPAQVQVRIDYFPNSDPGRHLVWVGEGKASRFGHFYPHDQPPLSFDEPGEYISVVTAEYRDARGKLWMGRQTSAGVIAPHERTLLLHGTRSFPYGHFIDRDYYGAVKRFSRRRDMTTSFFPAYNPALLPDPYAPYDPRDTLFIPSNGFNQSLVEPHLSMTLTDAELSTRLREAFRHASFPVPPSHQLSRGPWEYLKNVVQISSDSFGWFPADAAHGDELPIIPVGNDRWHPYTFPEFNRVDAYTYIGVVRPGFPVMTSVYQADAIGLYWLAGPNRFGFHYNTGINGDLPGDVYRIQAGAVLIDRESGKRYYDAYASAIAVVHSTGKATSISPPGERPLVQLNGRDHFLFIGLDTFSAMDVGEIIGLGGMVFPAVEALLRWTVTKPSGEVVVVGGRANRLGLVGGSSVIRVDEAGIYRIKVEVEYEELRGDVVGTTNGEYWHCALPKGNPPLLKTSLQAITRIDTKQGIAIPLNWPESLRNAKLHFGVMMPGQVLDQGTITEAKGRWEYDFSPLQRMVQFPNIDARNFTTGELELNNTVVFQFFLEAEKDGEKVYDSMRLVLRDDLLYNYRRLVSPEG